MRKYQIIFLDPDKKPLIIEAESFKEAVEKAVEEKADLSAADLRGTNQRESDLSAVNLRGTNLDYSVWPLWCGSLDVKIDKRIFCQLLYHALRAGKSVEDEEVQAFLNNPDVLKLANQFHRVEECGKLEPVQGKVKK